MHLQAFDINGMKFMTFFFSNGLWTPHKNVSFLVSTPSQPLTDGNKLVEEQNSLYSKTELKRLTLLKRTRDLKINAILICRSTNILTPLLRNQKVKVLFASETWVSWLKSLRNVEKYISSSFWNDGITNQTRHDCSCFFVPFTAHTDLWRLIYLLITQEIH